MRESGLHGSPWVFLDTSAHYALADPRDGNQARSFAISQRLIAQHWRLLTSNFVLAETHALLLARRGRAAAWRTLQAIDQGSVTIARVSIADELRARQIIAQYGDKDFSFTDTTSFAIMERLGIAHAFTFDDHFAQYGLIALTPNNF